MNVTCKSHKSLHISVVRRNLDEWQFIRSVKYDGLSCILKLFHKTNKIHLRMYWQCFALLHRDLDRFDASCSGYG